MMPWSTSSSGVVHRFLALTARSVGDVVLALSDLLWSLRRRF